MRRSTREAADLICAVGADRHSYTSWVNTVDAVLTPFFLADRWDYLDLRQDLRPARDLVDGFNSANFMKGKGHSGGRRHNRTLWEATEREVRPILEALHRGLLTLADRLTQSAPRPPLLPVLHPPSFARLRDDVAAETVAEGIAALVDEGVEQYEAARRSGWPGSVRTRSGSGMPPDFAVSQSFEEPLGWFLTREVRTRYRAALGELQPSAPVGSRLATTGMEHVEGLASGTTGATGRPVEESATYRDLAADVHPRIYAAYVAIAVNYLAEVRELMPKYAEDSGQGLRRDPVTVYGNVGFINSQVNNSSVSVAETIAGIDASIRTVADRGLTDVSSAIRALTEAVQQDPQLAEDLRAELLDHVADVADAAAAPDEPRRLSRARLAMGAITAAAGTSAQLGQAVTTWQTVLGQLF
ncbi:hypothetical protein ABZ920_23165 [Streptomyces sp. NPDC046831]|uniref:hypothetical protein n=1 Tax=Streptomyces sp. NPDC046831 TaxID=3154805 RepID=UPI0033F7D4D1